MPGLLGSIEVCANSTSFCASLARGGVAFGYIWCDDVVLESESASPRGICHGQECRKAVCSWCRLWNEQRARVGRRRERRSRSRDARVPLPQRRSRNSARSHRPESGAAEPGRLHPGLSRVGPRSDQGGPEGTRFLGRQGRGNRRRHHRFNASARRQGRDALGDSGRISQEPGRPCLVVERSHQSRGSGGDHRARREAQGRLPEEVWRLVQQ